MKKGLNPPGVHKHEGTVLLEIKTHFVVVLEVAHDMLPIALSCPQHPKYQYPSLASIPVTQLSHMRH